MSRGTIALALVILYGLSNAASANKFSNSSSHKSIGGKAQCISGTLQVPIVADNLEVLYNGPTSQSEVTQLLQEFVWVDSQAVVRLSGGRSTIEDTYGIHAKLCYPTNADKKSLNTVQLLTHGGSLDHTYYDMAKGSSYVDAAAEAGYATLSYDRLGTGLSAHPDPNQVVQSGSHVEIVHGLARMLRDGIESYTFENVIGLGHSFGSWYTQSAATKYPNDFDALVLTGTSSYFATAPVIHSSLALQIANTDASGRFKGLHNGYLVPAPYPSVHQFNLYYYPHFDENIMISQNNARQTVTIGELLTLPECMVPSTWSGPLDVVNGERDLAYCGGNCLHDGDQAAKVQPVFFPDAADKFQSFILPDTGHNINGHHRAQEAYDHIFGFLKTNGFNGFVQESGHDEL